MPRVTSLFGIHNIIVSEFGKKSCYKANRSMGASFLYKSESAPLSPYAWGAYQCQNSVDPSFM